MANWIERVVEPERLFLAWQAPDHIKERFRWAVAIIEPTKGDATLRYLRGGGEFEKHNQGRGMDELRQLGYRGYPAFNPKRHHAEGALEVFMRRLPPRSRPDFEDYKRQFRLSPGACLSNFALLGYTEAKLPSDGFSLVDPLQANVEACDLMIEIAGFRYYVDRVDEPMRVGQAVEIRAEPHNPYDPNAVEIRSNGQKIGNINRLQAQTFLSWLEGRQVSAMIEKLNGNSERPRAFIFVRIRRREKAKKSA